MNKIRVMNELLSNKIAAGEVVEKVVSIVKELVENSVDAKATNIKIDLKEAGIREIIVTDRKRERVKTGTSHPRRLRQIQKCDFDRDGTFRTASRTARQVGVLH